uniref:Glucuronosyltransferase n=1 Tax=Ascaris lumbricoides TaxID=6252 RepID=A0A0M3HJM3_ASCLU
MLSNNRYMDSVSRIHDIFLDRPMNSLEEAVFWTNRALRLAGREKTFKRKGMSLSLIDSFYLLHIAFLVLSIIVLCKNTFALFIPLSCLLINNESPQRPSINKCW